MNHNQSIRLEHLLLDLIKQRRGVSLQRFSEHEGVAIDADSFENDAAAAIRGLWLAVELLQSK